MHRTERAIIYSLLGLLSLASLPNLWSSSGRTAIASPASSADMLGPADGVRLLGTGKDDAGKELLVQSRDGRIAWGDGAFRKAYSVAFVDIGRILNPLMESGEMNEEREALTAELESKEAAYREQLEGFRERLEGLEPDSPEAEAILAEGNTVFEEYRAWGRDSITRRNALDVEHLQKAYREVLAAVDVVANRMGIDVVFRFIPADKDFKADDGNAALTEIRLRAAVKAPSELDITTEVLEELSLQDAAE